MHYHNPQFEDFYNGWERDNYQQHLAATSGRVSWKKLIALRQHLFLVGSAVLLLPGLPFALRDRKMRLPTR